MTKTLGPYQIHPFADVFPLIEGEEFEDLVMDIKRHGLRDPILLTHDRTVLVDGRNRYLACEAAGIAPAVVALPADYTESMILDLIVSKNVTRRQLTAGQKAFLALGYEKAFTEEEQKRQQAARQQTEDQPTEETPEDQRRSDPSGVGQVEDSRSPMKAARAVGSSPRAVQRAKTVSTFAPDLVDKVRSGSMALDQAEKQARQRMRTMPEAPPSEKPGRVMLTLRTHDGREVQYKKPEGKPTFNSTSDGEGISWARWSWNPVTGCLHGCSYCYARDMTFRFPQVNPIGFEPLFHHERLGAPANTRIPDEHRDDPTWHRVFVCSMADLYGRWVPDQWILEIHSVMAANPMWDYLLLTKFPSRYTQLDLPPTAWVGTSVDEQKRVRIAEDAFRKIDGVKVKWLSLEPLREPLKFNDLSMFDWVVIGAQTETNQGVGADFKLEPAFSPPFDWVVDLVAQARESGCRVHLKPNLVNGKPGMELPNEYPV